MKQTIFINYKLKKKIVLNLLIDQIFEAKVPVSSGMV